MPTLQPTANCCRAVRQQLRPPSETTWITDAVANTIVQRFCATSRPGRRFASFVPGPLESRRRLGKRHMAELYSFQSHHVAQPWALAITECFDKWIWQPPSREKGALLAVEQEETRATAWPGIMDWLSGVADNAEDTRKDAAIGLQGVDSSFSTRHVDHLLADMDTLSPDAFPERFRAFRKALAATVHHGIVPTEELCLTLTRVSQGIHQKYGRKLRDACISRLCYTLLDAIRDSPSSMPKDYRLPLWEDLLEQIASLQGQNFAMELLQLTVNLVPACYLDHLFASVLRVFTSHQSMYNWESKNASYRPKFQDLAEKAVTVLDEFPVAFKLKNFKKWIPGQLKIRQETGRNKSFGGFQAWWLSVLTRMPQVSEAHLDYAISSIFTRNHDDKDGQLSEAQINRLFLLCWKGQSYVARSNSSHGRPPFATLIRQVSGRVATKSLKAMLEHLCKELKSKGDLASLVKSFEVKCLQAHTLRRTDAWGMAMTAMACDDHRLAAQLHEILMFHRSKFHGYVDQICRAWDWQVCRKYAREILTDETLSVGQIRNLLGVHPEWKGQWIPAGAMIRNLKTSGGDDFIRFMATPSEEDVLRMMDELEQSADEIVTIWKSLDADRLRPEVERAMLNLVETRLRWFNRQHIRPRRRLLEALTAAVVQDLGKGDPGRPTRMEWLIGLIATHIDPSEAARMASNLKEWREDNLRARILDRELQRELEEYRLAQGREPT